MSGALDRLARRAGILPEYHQIDGSLHVCGPESAIALLRAMGFALSGEADAADALAALEAGGDGAPEPMLLAPGERRRLEGTDWRLTLEDGGALGPDVDDPVLMPALPLGVHTLYRAGRETMVVVSPPMAPQLPDLAGRDRVWGVMAALYGLRSGRNAGLGDFEDLAAAAEALAPSGAAFLGVNPLHDRGVAEAGPSPYSPSSRTTFETRHIALDRIPEYASALEAQALLAEAAPRLSAARAADLVDYGAAEIVLAALRQTFAAFNAAAGPRRDAFQAWRRRQSADLHLLSTYQALSERHGPDWRRWPAVLQAPAGPEVQAFVDGHAEEIEFHDWTQWIAQAQLSDAQARAKGAGMALGLYLDIAVGVRPGGGETWANRDAFAVGASLGAPPDLLNSEGQSWGLAPFSPIGLAAQRYAPFRRMLQSTMAAAGVVRIDHVIGLARSFWVPECGAPGAYVTFPLDMLLALTRLEAARSGCLVVGEDLGTVPDGLREALDGSGLYGCAIMPFERDGDAFVAPWDYRPRTLASFGTHDLPSLEGWWEGRDLDIRRRLGHLDDDALAEEQAARGRAREALCHLLESTWLLPQGIDPHHPPPALDGALWDAIHVLLARSASGLIAVSLDDIFAVKEQQNVPGDIDQQPNWRRKAPIAIEDMRESPEIAGVGRIMADAGRGAATET